MAQQKDVQGRKEFNAPRRNERAPQEGPSSKGKKGGNGAWSKKRARHMRTSLEKGESVSTVFDQTPEGRKKRQKLFIEGLKEIGTVKGGCQSAGVDRKTYYNWIEQHPEFKAEVEHALEDVADDLEEQVFVRAKDKSDLLLMFAVKKFKPQYRDNFRAPTEKPEEEEAQGVARSDVEKRLNLLAERRMERLVTEGAKGKLKLERSEEQEEDDEPDVEVVVKRSKRA